MGNVGSSGDAVLSDDEEPLSETVLTDVSSGDAGMDLSVLFDLTTVRNMFLHSSEPIGTNLLKIHKKDLLQWVEDKQSKGEDTLNFSQFMEFWINKGCSRDECVLIFKQFDLYDESVVDIEQIRLYLSSDERVGANTTFQKLLRNIERSGILPGIADSSVWNKPSTPDHHKVLLDFVLRNRLSSSHLHLPMLDSFHRQIDLRMKGLKKHLEAARKKVESQKGVVVAEEQQSVRQITTRCFLSLETSSNQGEAHKLINGRTTDYWQSEGRTGAHWIRLHMKPGIIVKQLQIYVAAADHSYVPSLIHVQAGSRTNHLRQMGEVRIPNRFGGYVTLLENCKKEYSVIQINIKRCHSDGCDARVRVVTVKGLRPDTAREGSLLDSSALWLLQLVRSTAVASIPSTPQLRNIILSQSKSAVMAMPPLSLAIGSTQRPVGLSGVVLEEVTDFMYSLLYDQSEGMSTDGLHSLLGLSVARGNVVNILKVLRLLFDNSDVQLSVCHLCYQMTDTSDTCKRSHGEQLSIQLVACDGGYKDDDNKPINVIYPGPDSFLSSEGKNKCNIVFKSRSSIHTEITQFNLKVSRGATGAKNGLVFVFDYPGEFNMEAVAKQLTQYDDWTATEYTDYVNSVKDALPGTVSIGQFSPVGYFETTSETDDIEVDMDFIRPGKYILLKLLGPRLVTAERVGVVYASFKGYIDVKVSVEDSELAVERLALLPDMTDDDVLVSGSSVALHLLSFTCALADDLERLRQQRRAGGGLATREPRLEMEGITLQGIWDTYSSLLDRSSVIDEACRLLLLQLLRYLLPYLSASSSKEKQEMKRDPAGHRQLTRKVFQHMCDIVDNSHRYRSSVQQAARDVILDGASVFFPDDETRHFHLMQMIDSNVKS